MRRVTFVLAASLVLALGCSSKQAGDTQDAASDEATSATEQATPAATPATGAVDAQVASATLSGTLGCGHCTYHMGDSCSAAVKTAEGEIVILDGVGNGHELFDRRQEQLTVAMEGTRSEDGKTFSVTSYEIQ